MKYCLEDIIRRYNGGEKLSFLFFWGHHPAADGQIAKSCLSQWWPVLFEIDGVTYNCAEQYMMACKARLFPGNEDLLELILKEKDPKNHKKYGRMVRNYDDRVWSEKRAWYVYQGNLAKFSQNNNLKEFLLNTGDDILVEASPYDTIWGIGMKAGEKGIENPKNWKGKNLLGFELKSVRDTLNGNWRGVVVKRLEFQDFYDMANCLNICLKGSYSQKEVDCNAHDYFSNYEWALEYGIVGEILVELAKKLDAASHTGFDDTNCLWWLYCLAKDLGLTNLSQDEYIALEDRVQCFVIGGCIE